MKHFALLAAAAAVCCSSFSLAQPTEQLNPFVVPASADAFREAMSPFIGTWETVSKDDNARQLSKRRTYSWDLAQDVVIELVHQKVRNEPWKHVGVTVLAPGGAIDEIVSHNFFPAGWSRIDTIQVGETDTGNLLLTTVIALDGRQVRTQMELVNESSMIERSWIRHGSDWQREPALEDKWERIMQTEPTLAAPDAASESDKTIVRSATVDATPAEAWRAWTTTEGMTEWWVEEADIELKIGGKFELYMLPDQPEYAGNRGTEGCTILAYAPERMLAATWNAPPSFPEQRAQHTRITVLFEPVEDGTKTEVTLIHSGWPADGMADRTSKWPRVYQYFEAAWTFVFDRMSMHFEDKAGNTPGG